MKETALKHCDEMLKYINAPDSLRKSFHEWRDRGIDIFPVGGLDLKDVGVPGGKNFKRVLTYLYNMWKEVDGHRRGGLLISLHNHVC